MPILTTRTRSGSSSVRTRLRLRLQDGEPAQAFAGVSSQAEWKASSNACEFSFEEQRFADTGALSAIAVAAEQAQRVFVATASAEDMESWAAAAAAVAETSAAAEAEQKRQTEAPVKSFFRPMFPFLAPKPDSSAACASAHLAWTLNSFRLAPIGCKV